MNATIANSILFRASHPMSFTVSNADIARAHEVLSKGQEMTTTNHGDGFREWVEGPTDMTQARIPFRNWLRTVAGHLGETVTIEYVLDIDPKSDGAKTGRLTNLGLVVGTDDVIRAWLEVGGDPCRPDFRVFRVQDIKAIGKVDGPEVTATDAVNLDETLEHCERCGQPCQPEETVCEICADLACDGEIDSNTKKEMEMPYRTDSDGRNYESWADVSLEISRQMDAFLGATDEQNAEAVAEWAEDGSTAIRDIRACGQEPQFDAADYQRWASESDYVNDLLHPAAAQLEPYLGRARAGLYFSWTLR